jgi:hypothetical protein
MKKINHDLYFFQCEFVGPKPPKPPDEEEQQEEREPEER